jgi:hypothetical protein
VLDGGRLLAHGSIVYRRPGQNAGKRAEQEWIRTYGRQVRFAAWCRGLGLGDGWICGRRRIEQRRAGIVDAAATGEPAARAGSVALGNGLPQYHA